MKTLHRSSRHKVFFGVCGGLAEYFNVDPVAVRIVMVLLGIMGAGIVFYLAAIIIMPAELPQENTNIAEQKPMSSVQSFSIIIGAMLVLLGIFALLDNFHILRIAHVWIIVRNIIIPCIVIAFGIGVLLRRKNAHGESSAQPDVPLEQTPLRAGQWYRSRRNRKILGVCAGIAAAMELDPTLVRLAWVVLSLTSLGLGLFLYIALAFILPEEPIVQSPH